MSDLMGQRLADTLEQLAAERHYSDSELRGILGRLMEAARHQGICARSTFERVVDTLLDGLDLRGSVPRAAVNQAHRVATRRRKLVEGGAWSVGDLADVRGQTSSAVHTWLSRQREYHTLFTVAHGREAFVPALLLDDAAEPYAGTERVILPLTEAGMDPWALWVWFDSAAAALDGARPADLLHAGQLDLLETAARLQGANAAKRASGRSQAA
ncbi:MAG: hypothetical protein ACR2HR_08005 [Euzebya sp.]